MVQLVVLLATYLNHLSLNLGVGIFHSASLPLEVARLVRLPGQKVPIKHQISKMT